MARVRKLKNHVKAAMAKGRVHKKKSLSVKIQLGWIPATNYVLSGEGAAGENGAPAGDLYVVIHVKEHHIFERDGNNLYC